MIDLATLNTVAACNAGAEIELSHPVTGEKLGIYINVLGKDSEVFKSHVRLTINARLRKAATEKKRAREPEVLTVEENEREGIALLADCTVGWRTGEVAEILFEGQALSCTTANAVRIYSALPWIREQVDTAIGDLENFLKA